MWYRRQHLSNQTLLKFADGELSLRRAARVRAHVALCDACRARGEALLAAAEEVARSYRQAFDPHNASLPEARARLERRMLEPQPGRREPRPTWMSPWSLAGVGGVALVLALTLWWLPGRGALVDGGQLPNAHLTPGATERTVVLRSACASDNDANNGVVTAALQQRVFHEYGIRDSQAGEFELDFLVTPGLGGTGNMRNLWPEPRSHAEWNAYVKDQLERYLQREVCRGQLPLNTAQAALSQDWITAYRKYFHTNRPLATPSIPSSRESAGLMSSSRGPSWAPWTVLATGTLDLRVFLPARLR